MLLIATIFGSCNDGVSWGAGSTRRRANRNGWINRKTAIRGGPSIPQKFCRQIAVARRFLSHYAISEVCLIVIFWVYLCLQPCPFRNSIGILIGRDSSWSLASQSFGSIAGSGSRSPEQSCWTG